LNKMGGLQSEARAGRRRSWILRHSAIVRVTHWINFLCLAVLLMSGLQIFNAHSALYWGQASDFPHPLLAMDARPDQQGALRGVTTVLGHDFDTTGVLGLSYVPGFGERVSRLGDIAWHAVAGDGPALAFLLRLDLHH
jgi:hypothetical protein